ncbi:MAG: tryptophan--tRNA ligase [Nanoarchaeota archaeon]|nr:tryptophan--tRNA ligase [Nanoarchaeota archaeon]
MKINITKRLLNRYPGVNYFGIEVKNMPNKKHNPRLEEKKKNIIEHVRKKVQNPKKIKLVESDNKFFAQFGKTSPIEYQLESIKNGKPIPIGTILKDILFMAEMKTYAMISGHDLDVCSGEFTYDLAAGGEQFLTINGRDQKIKKDDVLLYDKNQVITSHLYGPGYHDRITEKTKDVAYLFWFFEKITNAEKDSIINEFTKIIDLVKSKDAEIKIFESSIVDDGMENSFIDPYSSELVEDYNKMLVQFGMDRYNPDIFPQPNRIMRRGIVYGGRDLKRISDTIKKKKPFYVLSGIMPTSPMIHLGTKMVVENIAYFQKHDAVTYILVADLEAAAARGVSLEEGKKRAMEFHIPAYIALGLDPKKTYFYFQSENMTVIHLAYEFAKKITLNEFRAIYGSADPGRIMSAVTQVGDILFPQIHKKIMPGIIPVGSDQDPHIRLTRDVVARTKSRFGFVPVSSCYHKYMPSLDGSLKMSKSKPESCISLPEDPKIVCKKLKRALTGGRDSLEEQKKLGGEPEKCMVFELYKQHLIEDDDELDSIYKRCKAGTLLCGEDKEYACKKMTDFMENLEKGIDDARKNIDKLRFIKG